MKEELEKVFRVPFYPNLVILILVFSAAVPVENCRLQFSFLKAGAYFDCQCLTYSEDLWRCRNHHHPAECAVERGLSLLRQSE